MLNLNVLAGADLGGGCRGCALPPPEMTCGFLIQLVFCTHKKKTMWFIGVEVEQETSAPPPEKNPGSAPVLVYPSKKPFTFEGNKSIFIDPTFGIFVSGPLHSFVVNAGLYLKNRILHNFCPLLHH